MPDGSIGCLYERGHKHAYETITFARFSADWLTGAEAKQPQRRRVLFNRDGAPRTIPAPDKLDAKLEQGELVFSVKTWEGEYSSKDVPGGVESTPAVGAI